MNQTCYQELSLPPSRIHWSQEQSHAATADGDRPIIRVLALPPGLSWSALAEPTNGIVAAAFTCEGHTCVPSEFEVYVQYGDTSQMIQDRIAQALGEGRGE